MGKPHEMASLYDKPYEDSLCGVLRMDCPMTRLNRSFSEELEGCSLWRVMVTPSWHILMNFPSGAFYMDLKRSQ
ncbi:hypothetical protein J1N35_025503 [Gossypium stocksii]|uniref:Uncharacterized protein n=1 Tax=Gossypium stocksii TaxID=47602 RepID=A0A9D3V784_9ROSI|nr:hypothetical protein J1N35_025503 [Gossypium stocksii]